MDGSRWILFNASPDIRVQLEAFPKMRGVAAKRGTGIAAIVLMDSQIDHTTGLLMLREGCPHQVYCTPSVHEDLSTGFPIFRMLQAWNGGLEWHRIEHEQSFSVAGLEQLRLTPVHLASKAPPYSPHRDNPQPGDNIGMLIEDLGTGRRVFYAPGLGEVEKHLLPLMAEADCLLVDGTFWTDDEMRLREVGSKTARSMGHLPQWGPGGMLEILGQLPKPRKILIHINNTNPILDERSTQRRELERRGIEVAYDGLELCF